MPFALTEKLINVGTPFKQIYCPCTFKAILCTEHNFSIVDRSLTGTFGCLLSRLRQYLYVLLKCWQLTKDGAVHPL